MHVAMMHVSMVIHDAYSWFMIHYAHSFRDGTRSWDAGLQFESLRLFLCLCVTSSGGTEIEVYSNMFSRLPTEKIKNAKNKFEEEKACNLNYGRRTAVAAGGSHLREQHRAWWRVFPLCHWTSENFLLGVYF